MPNNIISTAELLALEPQQATGEEMSTEETGVASSETISTAELLSLDPENSVSKKDDSPEYEHISLEEFSELSDKNWFQREEQIVPILKERYEFKADGSESGVKIEESGGGTNAVRITLPGDEEGMVFDLPHSDDKAEMQAAYTNITEYIDSKQKKIAVSEDAASKVNEIFDSRAKSQKETKKEVSDLGVYGGSTIYGKAFVESTLDKERVKDGIFKRDENIASELREIFPSDYSFDAVNNFESAVEVGLPNGNKMIFNVSESNPESAKQIIDFIQSDSKGYVNTKKYREGKEELENYINEQLDLYIQNPDVAQSLGDDNVQKGVIKTIMNNIGSAGWQQLFFADDEEFQDLTRDDKNNLIKGTIQEILSHSNEVIDNRDLRTEIKRLNEEEGLDTKGILNHVEDKVKQSFTGTPEVKRVKRQIYVKGLQVDEETNPDKKEKLITELDNLNTIRKDLEGKDEDYTYYIDPTKGSRSLTIDKEGVILDLTEGVKEKQNQVQDKELTREELKELWLEQNIVWSHVSHDWANEKHWFKIDNNFTVKNLSNLEGFQNVVFRQKDGVPGVVMTDAQARKERQFLDLNVGGHNTRLYRYKETAIDKEVYNKQYALNEGLLSQEKLGFTGGFVESLSNSVSNITGDPKLKASTPTEIRNAYEGVMMEQGVELTAKEIEHVKDDVYFAVGQGMGTIPKLLVDFAVANKAIAVGTAVTGIDRIIKGLRASRYIVGGKTIKNQKNLLKAIKDKNPKWFNKKHGKVGSDTHNKRTLEWLTKNKGVVKPPSFLNKAKDVAIMSNIEGVKMEIAMQDPFNLSGEEVPIGSSYKTGVGFYAAGQIVPWAKMWSGIGGQRAGAWKGMYEYLVKAPVNFEIGARGGELMDALVQDMSGSSTWNNFMEDHFGDYDENIKMTISNLFTGFAMRAHKFNKYDFASENKLAAVERAMRIKLNNSYERNEKGEFIIDTQTGKKKLKEGITEENIEKYETTWGLAKSRLNAINEVKMYQDPVMGALKLYNENLPTIKALNAEGKTKIIMQEMSEGKNASFDVVKNGEKYSDGKINKSGKDMYEFVYDPKKIDAGVAPHELGHFTLRELFGKDVMFKGKTLKAFEDIMRQIKVVGQDLKTGEAKEMTLLDLFRQSDVGKNQKKYNVERTREEEMFTYLAEYLSNGTNLRNVRKQYGFGLFAGGIQKILGEFGQRTNLNTEKEVVEWFSKYIENIKKGVADKKQLKELEKFISPIRTKNQKKKREALDDKVGQGETKEMRSEDLELRIKEAQDKIKSLPAFLQYQEDKDVSKYANNPEVKSLLNKIAKYKEAIKINKSIPEVSVVDYINRGYETTEGREINDFARKDGRQMTNKQWKSEGFEKARLELFKEGNVFEKIITKGLKFPVYGRTRSEWIMDVSFGIEGKGKIDKKTGEEAKTFITKGMEGILKRFNPEVNESLSGWVNSQYQLRRGDVSNFYKTNPKPGTIDAPKGKAGQTLGDNLRADADYRHKVFETEDITKSWAENLRDAKYEEVVEVEGERMLKNYLPIDKKIFEEKDGWKQTIEKGIKEGQFGEETGYKDIQDLAFDFTLKMLGVELTPTQKKNLNDMSATGLRSLQGFIESGMNKPVMEKRVDKETGETKTRQKVNELGELQTSRVEFADVVADLMPEATVMFDKGVSEKLKGTSTYRRLGKLSPLYHKAMSKDYSAAEMAKMGYLVNPKPNADGSWRVATGPGGNILLKGKAKGETIKGKDIKEILGKKQDGTYKTLKEDRGLAGVSRRTIDVIGQAITSQTGHKYVKANPEVVSPVNATRFLFNMSAGRSKKMFSSALELKFDIFEKKEIFDGVQTPEFAHVYRDYQSQKTKKGDPIKNPLGKAMRDYFTSLGPESVFTGKDIKKIKKNLKNAGEQIENKLQLGEGVNTKALAVRIGKIITTPQELSTIEKDLIKQGKENIYETNLDYLFKTPEGIKLGETVDRLIMEWGQKTYGDPWYENIMHLSTTSGTGRGGFKDGDILGSNKGTNRFATYKTAEDPRGIVKKIKTNRKFDLISRSNSNLVGDKNGAMKFIEFTKESKSMNKAKVEKLYEYGETNKEMLRGIVGELRRAFKEGEIDSRHVRYILEQGGGLMPGIIKKAASLAVLPKGTPAELFKTHGAEWVLEHIIPAQYMKARIYEYILSGSKESYNKMDLTLKQYHTTFIPKRLDTAVNKLYLSELPPEYLPGMEAMEYRYYRNPYRFDFNIGLEVVAGPNKGKVYDINPTFTHTQLQARQRAMEKYTNDIFGKVGLMEAVKNKLYSEKLEDLKDIDKAMANGRKLVKERRGMSTWDFDDTLATTKSGVRARIPNADGKPKPSRKVIFLAGGAGSGKSNVVKKLGLEKDGFKIVNQDISLEWLKKNNGLPENMNDLTKEQKSVLGKLGYQARTIAKRKMMKFQGNAEGIVVDGTGGSMKSMEKLVKEFKDKGYDTSMLFVETSLETALQRNRARKERSLLDKIVEKNHEAVQGNKEGFRTMFGERFMEVKTDNLKQEDSMPTELVNKMNDFIRSYEKRRLDAEEFATEGKEILDKGGEFDFAEFNVVTGGQRGPFFEKALERSKKFGNEHQYVLTARPPESAEPIHKFLKSQGLDIPLKNITGLGNSTGEAKALWMLKKFAEGYNDMYFADDAMQNVEAVKDVLKQVDVKSKVVQARAINNVKNVEKLDSPDVYNDIKYSKKLELEYKNTISKNRPDLVRENLVDETVNNMYDFIDGLNIPINKRKKYQQATVKWLATSNMKLPEDGYKVKDAIDLAEKYKEDVFSYRNPNEIIEKYAGKAKAKPTNPKTVKEFAKGTVTNKKHGITEHVVEETEAGMMSVRKVIDTHWGPKSNPWCITARSEKQRVEPRQYGYELAKTKQDAQARKQQLESEGFIVEIRDRGQNIKSKKEFQYDLSIKELSKGPGEMEGAWENWTTYNKGPKSIVFQNGRLLAFKANDQYWDRMDNPTDAPVVNIKKGRVTEKTELVPIGGGKVSEFVMETRTVSKDKKTVTTEYFTETKDYLEGTKVVENRVNGITVKSTRSRKDGTIQEIINYDKKGKAISGKNFEPNGKLVAVNTYGRIFGEMKPEQIVKEKGDQIEQIGIETATGIQDIFAESLVGGKVAEIGFQLKKGVTLESVLKTSPDGKIRLDLEKAAKADPNARAMFPGVRPTTLVEMIKPTKPVAKEGMQAIESVKKVLDQLDTKSNVQQDLRMFSERLETEINDIMEYSLNIESKKRFSAVEGKTRGKDIRRRKLIMPDTAADLELLIEPLYGKGKEGIENKKWFEKNFYKPWERSINDLNTARQKSFNEYADLRKSNKDVVKDLQKEVEGTAFTNDMAARVYLYNKAGFKVPGLAKTSETKLVNHVKNNPKLLAYAENVSRLTGIKTGLNQPKESWWAETLATEIQDIGQGVSRKRFLQDWIDRKNKIFSPENLNKMESKLGTRWRETIEDMFDRMETGRTRSMKLGTGGAEVMNYLNGSVGTIMNFNTRSASLQLISSVNFINHAENNPLAATRAFLNQKQYWKDFMTIMNSDMLVQRRAGLKINVTEQELASAAAKSQNKARAAIAWILKQGYLPTKMADSFAIASGGATYYRNRIKMYEKQGLSTKEAEKKAFVDFQAVAEKTQQSSRPDLLSQQQTSFIGRLVLPFANTPMQMNRIMVKEALDLGKGRYKGFFGDNSFTHKASKIAYYGAVQSLIFAGLQSALFAAMGFDPDSEAIDEKKARTVNTVLDSFLRGMGWQTAVISGIKNAILEFKKQNEKGFGADYDEVVEDLLNISPTIGSKYSKLDEMGNTYKYNKKEILEKGLSLDNTPALELTAQGTEAIFNIPVHRMMKKADNIEGALNEQHETWQRILMGLGWSKWDVGVSDYQKEKKEKKTKSKSTQGRRGGRGGGRGR